MNGPVTCPELVEVKARKCKICDGPAGGAHFGVDSCRACAAFFRRTLISRRKFECNSSGGCRTPRDCKKCRFDRCVAAGMLPTLVLRNKSLDDDGCLPIQKALTSHPQIILLHRMLANYQDFTRDRLAFEQEYNYSRADCVLSRLQLTPPDEPRFSVYIANLDHNNGIFKGVGELAIKFLLISFDEIYSMEEEDKFAILQKFIFLLNIGEGYYRAAKTFKERPLEGFPYFATLTTTCSFVDHYDGSEAVRRCGRDKCHELNEQFRDMLVPILDRMALTEIEFVATLVLALWTLMTSERVDSQMAKIGDSYRKRVFEELHVLYRDEFKLDDYAARLGDLMALSNSIQMSATTLISELQFFNFFDVFKKDSFTSIIVRKTAVKEEHV